VGYGKQISKYDHSLLLKDTIGNYIPTINNMKGNFNYYYFNTVTDLSLGMDLFLNDSFLVKLQLTPQFNYLFINSKSILVNDPLETVCKLWERLCRF
tara:strand:- start:663 stop:953 length:291 start_codon:yes stop_codon:yes gene_type:complete